MIIRLPLAVIPFAALAVLAAAFFTELRQVPPAYAANFTVDREDDPTVATADDCVEATADDCSLRGAIVKANANSGDVDVITLPAGIYILDETASASLGGDLDLTTGMSIIGAGSELTTINANGGTFPSALSTRAARDARSRFPA